ncbi:MAG: electron transfer flavoprotein [Anaerotardibacter sp.]
MKVVVCFKSVYDDASIRVNSADKTLDYTAVPHVVSLYDLNAIEVAAQFAESSKEHTLVALTAGDTKIHDTTMRKDVAARGASEVFLVMDDALYEAETYQTATALAAAIKKIGDVDLIICGDGSADVYAHQVGIQLGEILGIPNVNGVCEFSAEGNTIKVKRELDEIVESLSMPTPCVLSCLSDMAQPRVCNVMQIMTAGKKPVHEWSLADLGIEDPGKRYELGTTVLPAPSPRKLEFYENTPEGIDQFVEKLHTYLMTEGA